MFLLCLKVFAARIIDVSLGTVRTMFTVKGKRLIASIIGFFEVLIWFLVVREALSTDESGIFVAISYALGFATGTYIGGFLSSILIKGKVIVRVFTDNLTLADTLRNEKYGVSSIECKGYNGSERHMLYISVDNAKEKELRKLVRELDKNAFIIESETNYTENGYYK